MNNIIAFKAASLASIPSQLTDNKSDNKTGNKLITFREQTDNKDNNKVTEKYITDNVTSNDDEPISSIIGSIKKLYGIQKIIFNYVVQLCTQRGLLNTGEVLCNDLALAASCSSGCIRTSLIRLVEKKLILRLAGKRCRGGYMVLGITHEILNANFMLNNELTSNRTDNNQLYISSYYKNNTKALPDEWKKIDIEPLCHIGFSELQLHQLFETKMADPDLVQDSIYKFAFALEHKEKTKAYPDPLNILMGVLKKGRMWVEASYVSPKIIALRELAHEKQREKEEYDMLITKLADLEFPKWKMNLTEAEIEAIVPSHTLRIKTYAAVAAALRIYFVEKVLLPRIEKENLPQGMRRLK